MGGLVDIDQTAAAHEWCSIARDSIGRVLGKEYTQKIILCGEEGRMRGS
jgi:hypothetical protein